MFFYGYVIYICSHLDLYMFFYGCHVQPADITERRSTHVRIRIRQEYQDFNRASAISVRALCSPTTQRSVQQIEPNFVDVEAKHRPLYRYDLLLPSLALAFRRLADLCRCSNLRLVTLLRFGPFLRY